MTIIDVGQGDGILLYSNNKTMLIDTGNDNTYLANNMIKYFKSLGIKQIDYLVITHGDMDHLGNTKYLVNNFKVKKLFINNNEINSNEKELFNLMKVEKIKEKDIFNLNNIKLISINKEFENENDSSIIFYMTINKYSILLTGDATKKSEDYIINNYNLRNINMLKVGHHGSNTSSSENFLKIVNPKDCIISVGKNNRYGHPTDKVIKRLNNYCNIYRTDLHGTININLNNK